VLSGEAHDYHLTDVGIPEVDDAFLIIMNAASDPIDFILPAFKNCRQWELLIDTSAPGGFCPGCYEPPGKQYSVAQHSFLLFVRQEIGKLGLSREPS
jgi:glycogen operon protein